MSSVSSPEDTQITIPCAIKCLCLYTWWNGTMEGSYCLLRRPDKKTLNLAGQTVTLDCRTLKVFSDSEVVTLLFFTTLPPSCTSKPVAAI